MPDSEPMVLPADLPVSVMLVHLSGFCLTLWPPKKTWCEGGMWKVEQMPRRRRRGGMSSDKAERLGGLALGEVLVRGENFAARKEDSVHLTRQGRFVPGSSRVWK